MPTYESRLAGAQSWVDPATLPQYGDASQISGNAPDFVKQLSSNTLGSYGVGDSDAFAHSAGRAIRITSVDIDRKGDRWEACAVAEVTVGKNMLNGAGVMHGGCLCYLIDNCASLPLVALGLMQNINGVGVSQAMNIVFHAPAALGAKLRIESRSVTLGGRIMTSRCEVTNLHSGKTVASAFLTKMQPKL
ncbi:HotDog domain-containing protein [Cristinia sonorae]|uniref:HotDog domain-containing protein n=1 Tax=Cristinia sonorae TaxID=1940300 RepID=A0A8K0UQV6_9AGAR|nr:HotDog domain-containing protein [Cristinia sonorae]